MLEELARILCRKKVIQTLLPEVSAAVVRIVPCDWMRFDLADERERLWSRFVKTGGTAERPGLGEVPRLAFKEVESLREIEGGFEVSLPLGIGEPSGRWVLRRKTESFEADLPSLRAMAHVLALGLRARPFEPPSKPRSPFDEGGPLV